MQRRLLLPLGLAVTGLLVLAAVASRGRPLSGGGAGEGPTAGFFDYVFTSLLIVGALLVAFTVWAALVSDPAARKPPPSRSRYLSSLLAFAGAVAIAWALSQTGFAKRLHELAQQEAARQQGTATAAAPKQAPPGSRGARLRWDEVAIVLGLLAAAGVAVAAGRTRNRPGALGRRLSSQEAVSRALDESLDDLRAEPDLRRAIIAAYARMEGALGAAGLRRRPAEAPLEYLERALLELETSGAAVSRLTELFEWAKFSQHDPEPRMRDEAVDALVAVRDELRAPAREAVPA